MAPQYKLTYFNLRGTLEPSRLMLAYLNIPYEDIRVTFEEWAELKKTAPFRTLPTLEVDGKVMNQSISIARYLGRKYNLTGKDDWESFQCDAIVDSMYDLIIEIVNTRLIEDEQKKKEAEDKFKNETVPFFMKDMEKLATQNGGHLVGSKISWADFFVICLIDSMGMNYKEDMFSNFPELNKLQNKIFSNPSIATWIAKRPVTEF